MALSTMDHLTSDAEIAALRDRLADGPRLPLAEPVLDGAAARQAARKAVADLVDVKAMDAVLAQIKGDGLRLTGPGGFLSELVKSVLERGLQAELAEHLGYAAHDPAGKGSGNSRNGSTPKTVQSEIGPIDVRVPRDRAGTFTPMLLPKHGPASGWAVRRGHQLVRGRDDGAGHLPSPAPGLRHRGRPGHHLHDHR